MTKTYDVYRDGTRIASGLIVPSYVDTGLVNGVPHIYRVSAVVGGVESPLSASVSATPLAATIPVLYGSGIGGDTLANTQLTTGQNPQYMRFRAAVSDTMATVTIYNQQSAGYGLGTGGTYKVELRTDDGSTNHFPTATVLATQNMPAPGGTNAQQKVTFAVLGGVIAGTIYHLVWTNTDASPTANFFSPDYWFYRVTPTGMPDGRLSPKFPTTDLGHGYWTGSAWFERVGFQPVIDIGYTGGVHQGQCYGEASLASGQQGKITGTTNMVRENFTVSGGNKTISGVGIRLLRIAGGTDPLTVSLLDGTNTLIDSFTIPAASIATGLAPNGADSVQGDGSNALWVTGTFPTTHTLVNGSTYHLQFSTAATTTYWAWVNRRLSYGYSNYTAVTAFADGIAEVTADGSTWTALGTSGNKHDLQFYFA